ncbi:nitrate reductase molybdenum cofactor assembly chaperone [Streptomyces bambusae]|uniref:nitrate reductase molybdenum cofactor assembly chaperone n=1 Tax=Streptomyces bambusae TaxID=1550616 RepID=UPI001CFFE5E8|nr:nitrate reductase molybdenum cofactor assembly chaperone [Streptomyces bambusae]MCB5169340.1 nitrate reductase molybdenum cofactor assembly chaperone [Streptomyces bambusae]
MSGDALVRLVAGCVLQYPGDRFHDELPRLRAALAGATAEPAALLGEFLDDAERHSAAALCARYTDTFDTRNRRCLYLTWWTDGDTRRRGLSLVRLKRIYRDFGLEFAGEELPDFLPAALEFAALREAAGTELLQEHRAGLELLRLALAEAGSPYAAVLAAVCATLPGPSPETKAAARALARSGPPQELVGAGTALEPFGPGIDAPADLPWPSLAERTPA